MYTLRDHRFVRQWMFWSRTMSVLKSIWILTPCQLHRVISGLTNRKLSPEDWRTENSPEDWRTENYQWKLTAAMCSVQAQQCDPGWWDGSGQNDSDCGVSGVPVQCSTALRSLPAGSSPVHAQCLAKGVWAVGTGAQCRRLHWRCHQ